MAEELSIFVEINFRESYQIKYLAVPSFHEFAKKWKTKVLRKFFYFKVIGLFSRR